MPNNRRNANLFPAPPPLRGAGLSLRQAAASMATAPCAARRLKAGASPRRAPWVRIGLDGLDLRRQVGRRRQHRRHLVAGHGQPGAQHGSTDPGFIDERMRGMGAVP